MEKLFLIKLSNSKFAALVNYFKNKFRTVPDALPIID